MWEVEGLLKCLAQRKIDYELRLGVVNRCIPHGRTLNLG